MYKKIYQILEETGKVKTAMVLNGSYKGRKCLIKEDHCTAFDGGMAEEFWKKYEEQLGILSGYKKLLHIDETEFFCRDLCKKSSADHSWRRPCVSACSKNRQDVGISCNSYG